LGQKANLSAPGGLIYFQSQEVQKTCSKSAQNTTISCKKMQKDVHFWQKSTKKRSFLPSFFDEKQISPITSTFLPSPTTPFFKISLKNPHFLDFLSFFHPFLFRLFTFVSLCFCFRRKLWAGFVFWLFEFV
jgi:hypothetical protein